MAIFWFRAQNAPIKTNETLFTELKNIYIRNVCISKFSSFNAISKKNHLKSIVSWDLVIEAPNLAET